MQRFGSHVMKLIPMHDWFENLLSENLEEVMNVAGSW
jgi:ubiquinone biosynthesis protein COQ9